MADEVTCAIFEYNGVGRLVQCLEPIAAGRYCKEHAKLQVMTLRATIRADWQRVWRDRAELKRLELALGLEPTRFGGEGDGNA